ncbi:hypothetical protein MNEG_4736 [Monoraphidium neglectum]|uniref:Uncharacterized protein n=1 Tax=Monoraphidium neglectum TaxID=145388 RepID=A0A0D2MS60_9CHLO|nr:hypothetical protein MNEG_4736 [Monoraphidium neglectum]KIZ03227.1 hypothetical protein MNEG_4736 [Monoraphidium neglectum]|eukprot:XP_013902246.1 hypothetical protein MNEG_4736 [Monoraphidium neglectum]
MLLVQAVSQHRQKRSSDVITSLNNLLSAYRAQPEAGGVGAVQWGEHEELKELFATYCGRVEDGAKREELAGLFGLAPSERDEVAAAVAAATASGEKAKQQAEEEKDEVDLFF